MSSTAKRSQLVNIWKQKLDMPLNLKHYGRASRLYGTKREAVLRSVYSEWLFSNPELRQQNAAILEINELQNADSWVLIKLIASVLLIP